MKYAGSGLDSSSKDPDSNTIQVGVFLKGRHDFYVNNSNPSPNQHCEEGSTKYCCQYCIYLRFHSRML